MVARAIRRRKRGLRQSRAEPPCERGAGCVDRVRARNLSVVYSRRIAPALGAGPESQPRGTAANRLRPSLPACRSSHAARSSARRGGSRRATAAVKPFLLRSTHLIARNWSVRSGVSLRTPVYQRCRTAADSDHGRLRAAERKRACHRVTACPNGDTLTGNVRVEGIENGARLSLTRGHRVQATKAGEWHTRPPAGPTLDAIVSRDGDARAPFTAGLGKWYRVCCRSFR
jgi:hypothetical protein